MGFKLPVISQSPMLVFIMPAGGFFALGCIIALVNKLKHRKPPKEISCKGCPNASACGMNEGDCEKGAEL